ncbi:hypothetical protein FACS1894214_0110 [Planctomycetales bacterium]|nr:hypothetical protein FACS1894214_0110 [Planctomycetales bacterium]
MAMYPYEALGLLKNSNEKFWQKEYSGQIEPVNKALVPFYRYQKYSGFIGQGLVETVSIPPKDISDTYTADDDKHPICVSRVQKTLDGSLIFESSKGIHFALQPNIRSFKRIKEISDPNGDDLEKGNYEFSKTDVFETQPKDDASVTDKIIWAVRQAGNTGFYGHKNDFELIKENQRAFEQDVNAGSLQSLQSQPKMKPVEPIRLKINEQGEVEYGNGRIFLSLIEDGVFIRGLCGEELRMEGGNITLSCPGNITMMPGRSFVTMSGEDAVLKAKKSIDIAAVDNDVRIKAERNLDMVGGMSGNGRTLIENQSAGEPSLDNVQGKEGEEIVGGGVTIKSKKLTSIQGKNVFVQSYEKGEIFIDAGLEGGQVNIHGRQVNAVSSSNIELAAGIYEGAKASEGSGNIVRIYSTSVAIPKSLSVFENIYAKQVIADEGCNKDPLEEKYKNFQEDSGMAKSLAANNESTDKRLEQLYELYDDEDKIGSEEMQKNYTFSYRNSEQCGANTFDFITPYWMEIFQSSVVSALPLWEEKEYSYQAEAESSGIKQMSWPGYEAWENEQKVEVRENVWYDAENGNDLDGTDAPSESGTNTSQTPSQFYRIIKK